ncbi:MAG TPA: hypothetical protein VIL89_10225, partial [Clostridia bacterium]
YMLSYFLSDSNTIYLKLQTIQTIYTAIKFIIPLLSAAALLIILISGKPARNIRITVIISCAVLLAVSFILYMSGNIFFVYSFEKTAPGISNVFKPFIEKAVTILFLRSVIICLLAVPAVLVFSIRPVANALNRNSKKLAALLVVIFAAVFSLYYHELYTVISKYKSFTALENAIVLNNDEQAVHSLVIKLRKEGSDEPVCNAKLVIYGMDTSDNPLWISAYSDTNGDARFILPKGSFNVYSDISTLPDDSISFGTVSINIDKPGNSWYTLHISYNAQD